MKIEVRMIIPPGDITSAILSKWFKNNGDYVEEGEIIAECEAEKVNLDIIAPVNGFLLKIEKHEEWKSMSEIYCAGLEIKMKNDNNIKILFLSQEDTIKAGS